MFGILSITGIVFIIINLTTAILTNEYLIPTIPFYILNIIPIVAVDILLSKLSTPKTKIVNYIVGAVIGSIFFTLYYPLITHTYNEVLSNSQTVWPSLTSPIYFKMIDKIYPLMVIPAAVTGILATIISSSEFKIRTKIKDICKIISSYYVERDYAMEAVKVQPSKVCKEKYALR